MQRHAHVQRANRAPCFRVERPLRRLAEKLSGLAVEYSLVLLHSSQDGKREAVLHFDIGQGSPTWKVLADPEGNEFCILRVQPPEEKAQ